MVEVSIIIASFNTRDLIKKCLECIRNADLSISYEVVIVDNASRDGTVTMLGQEHPYVRIFQAAENIGFARANNVGMRMAKGKHFLFLNSDAFVSQGLIEGMLEFFENHPTVGALGPQVLNPDGTFQSAGFPPYGIFLLTIRPNVEKSLSRICPRLRRRKARREGNLVRKVGWLSGCCLMVSRRAIETVGMLNEGFDFYCEDVEWCHRARKKGFEIWNLGYLKVIHQGQGSGAVMFTPNYWERATIELHVNCMGRSRSVIVHALFLLQSIAAYLFSFLLGRELERPGIEERIRFEGKVLVGIIVGKR